MGWVGAGSEKGKAESISTTGDGADREVGLIFTEIVVELFRNTQCPKIDWRSQRMTG